MNVCIGVQKGETGINKWSPEDVQSSETTQYTIMVDT